MSRAFVRETDQDAGMVPLPDRPISAHRNLVTRRGWLLIEQEVAQYRRDLARATAAGEREAVSRISRELRYWTARHASAEIVEAAPSTGRVVFGAAVAVLREDGTKVTFRIVGEDEADPAAGRIAWTSPVAQALLGSELGEIRELPSGDVEVMSIDAAPESLEQVS
jgi:transcription elongation GreA/GreB family factor